MSKENELPSEEMLDNLVPNFLYGLSNIEDGVFSKLVTFFNQAYRDLSQYEDFDDSAYREDWIEKLSFLDSLQVAFNGFTHEEIAHALNDAIGTLTECNRNKKKK